MDSIPPQHRLERADCLAWLRGAAGARRALRSDLPGSADVLEFQAHAGVLDVQRDHAELIEECMRLLAPAGTLVFSTNAQRFRLEESVTERWAVEDLSAATLPFDFARHPRIHRCFELRRP